MDVLSLGAIWLSLLFLLGGSSSNASVPQSIDNAPPVTSPPTCDNCVVSVPEPINNIGIAFSLCGLVVLRKITKRK